MNRTRLISVVFLLTTGSFVACAHEDVSQEPAAPGSNAAEYGATNKQMSSTDSSIVEQLSAARCDREQSCNNVGDGRNYASHQVCMDQMRGSMANDLNAYKCPHGIDRENLDHCMAAIRNEQCDHLLDTLSRMDKCRASQLCLKGST